MAAYGRPAAAYGRPRAEELAPIECYLRLIHWACLTQAPLTRGR